MKNKQSGFTLLEILLVVGIIAILAGIVIVAINPSKQLATVRNTERQSDIKQIDSAINQYYIANGKYPNSVLDLSSNYKEVCDTGAATSSSSYCGELIDLYELVPTYLTAIPKDPKATSTEKRTGYYISKPAQRLVTNSGLAELDKVIAIGTTTVVTPTVPVAAWHLVFKSNDPSIWGTDYGWIGDPKYSLATNKIPTDMTKIKLVWNGNEKSVDLNHSNLLNCVKANGNYYWNGSKLNGFNAIHLGIVDSSLSTSGPSSGEVVVGLSCQTDRGGWGFGHVAYYDDRQGFGWNGVNTNVPLIPTVEIYVYSLTGIQ